MLEYIVCSAVFLYLLYCYYQKKTDTIPCPKGWPHIGNAAQLYMTKQHLKLESWAAELGGLYKINLAGTFVYVVNGYDEMYQVLVTKGKDFAGRSDYYRNTFKDEHKNFASSHLSPKMHSIKKEVLHHLKLYGDAKEKNEQLVLTVANAMVDRLRVMNGKPINVRLIIQETITDTICLSVLGRRASDQELELLYSWVEVLTSTFAMGGLENLLDVFPWLRFIGNKTYKAMVEYKAIQQFQFALWKKEVSQDVGSDQLSANFLAKLLQIMNGENKYDYDEDNILKAVFDMFGGGVSSSTSALSALINVLVHNDEVQKQLHQESMQVLGIRQVSLADKQNMPYHMATIYEILRYTSPAPLGLPHETVCDTRISEHHIPKGSMVWPNIWALHHDPKFWDDPYSFRPEYFLNSSGGLVAADHPARKHMMAFGAGPRVCPGEVFALSRLFLLVAILVQQFDIKPATSLDEQPSADCRKLKIGLVLFPEDFKVRFIPRDGQL